MTIRSYALPCLETMSRMAAAAFLRAASFACLLTAGAFFFLSALAAFFSALAALLRPATTSRRATRVAAVCGSEGEGRVRRWPLGYRHARTAKKSASPRAARRARGRGDARETASARRGGRTARGGRAKPETAPHW